MVYNKRYNLCVTSHFFTCLLIVFSGHTSSAHWKMNPYDRGDAMGRENIPQFNILWPLSQKILRLR